MCLSKSLRFDLEHYQDHDAPGLTPHAMQMVQATWLRLTAAELSGVRTMSELTERVEERYSLSHEQATRDVEFWALAKQF
jgi:phage gp29-like protein